MKLLILIFLIAYYYSNTEYNLKILHIKKYDSTKTQLPYAGICVDIKDLDNDLASYLSFYSKNGSINQDLKYEFLYNDCYLNYTYTQDNQSLITKRKDKSSLYKKEFTYEYEFKKKENANYIFVIYSDYNGTELTITHLGIESSKIIFIFLGIIIFIIVSIFFICFCWYKFCKKREKENLEDESPIMGLEYKNAIIEG